MARIRTIKPETWTSEQVMNLTPLARLAFIGLWNFCDDGGNHPASARTLKASVFPSDDIAATEVETLVTQMLDQGLLTTYEAGGKTFWHVTGWHHQRIDKPTFKHPPFPNQSVNARRVINDELPTTPGALDEPSSNGRGAIDASSPPEGKIEEGNGKEDEESIDSAGAEPSASTDSCPHQQIINIYHEVLPAARRVREWTPTRQQSLRARWREKSERQNLDWWRRYFEYVAASDFLCGRSTPSSGRKAFDVSLEWLCKSENLVKVVEGKYEN